MVHQTTIRLPDDLYEWLFEHCAANGLPLNGVIVDAVQKWAREEELEDARLEDADTGAGDD